MLELRQLEKDDNAELANLIRAVFHEFDAPTEGTVYSDPTTDDLFLLFKRESSVLWVATTDEVLLGCCGIYPSDNLPADCVELVKFYLSPKARGKGLGRKLLEKSIDSAREMNYKSIYLESLPAFSRALNIYHKQGFTLLDSPFGSSDHPACNVWMLKTLH